MADVKTHADSLRFYLTGAASDGAAQADPDASLGNYRSSTEITTFTHTVNSPIANITIDYISGANGSGTGSLTATGVDTVTWAAPGGAAGPAVTILNGESKLLEASGAPGKFIRISRTSATDLAGAATIDIAYEQNNVIGMDNVSSAEAAAGDSEYRIFMAKVEAATEIKNLKAYISTLGGQQVSASAQLAASGSGTIGLSSGNFNDWPETGLCRVEDSGNSLKEIIYYSSRTSTALTVPTAGRGRLGTAAQAGAATDIINAVPGMRIAVEAPVADAVQTIADESTPPTGITWITGITPDTGIQIGDLASLAMRAIHQERDVIAGAIGQSGNLRLINFSYDAA